jgi:hypothetical protein
LRHNTLIINPNPKKCPASQSRTFLLAQITKRVISSYYSIKCMQAKYPVLFFVAVLIGLSSCKNNDNVFPPKVSAFVNIVNASADTLNVYINGTRQNNSSSFFPAAQSFYLPFPAGAPNLQFKKAGGFNVLYTVPLTLKDSLSYSLYLTGENAASTFSTIDTLLIDSGASRIRFVNASPDAGALTVTLNDTLYYPNKVFKSSSIFYNISNGQKEVKVYLAGTTAPKLDTLITFQQNSAYTLFTKGLLKGKGGAVFDIGVVFNASN